MDKTPGLELTGKFDLASTKFLSGILIGMSFLKGMFPISY
jgi:hypothetical protein